MSTKEVSQFWNATKTYLEQKKIDVAVPSNTTNTTNTQILKSKGLEVVKGNSQASSPLIPIFFFLRSISRKSGHLH